jgi:hypothetical protein
MSNCQIREAYKLSVHICINIIEINESKIPSRLALYNLLNEGPILYLNLTVACFKIILLVALLSINMVQPILFFITIIRILVFIFIIFILSKDYLQQVDCYFIFNT